MRHWTFFLVFSFVLVAGSFSSHGAFAQDLKIFRDAALYDSREKISQGRNVADINDVDPVFVQLFGNNALVEDSEFLGEEVAVAYQFDDDGLFQVSILSSGGKVFRQSLIQSLLKQGFQMLRMVDDTGEFDVVKQVRSGNRNTFAEDLAAFESNALLNSSQLIYIYLDLSQSRSLVKSANSYIDVYHSMPDNTRVAEVRLLNGIVVVTLNYSKIQDQKVKDKQQTEEF